MCSIRNKDSVHVEIPYQTAKFKFVNIFNPRRMREGYGSRFVSVCVCVSVTELAATYLVYTLKVGCH